MKKVGLYAGALILAWFGFITIALPMKVRDVVQRINADCAGRCDINYKSATFALLKPSQLVLKDVKVDAQLENIKVSVTIPTARLNLVLRTLRKDKIRLESLVIENPEFLVVDSKGPTPGPILNRLSLDTLESKSGRLIYGANQATGLNIALGRGSIASLEGIPRLKWQGSARGFSFQASADLRPYNLQLEQGLILDAVFMKFDSSQKLIKKFPQPEELKIQIWSRRATVAKKGNPLPHKTFAGKPSDSLISMFDRALN